MRGSTPVKRVRYTPVRVRALINTCLPGRFWHSIVPGKTTPRFRYFYYVQRWCIRETHEPQLQRQNLENLPARVQNKLRLMRCFPHQSLAGFIKFVSSSTTGDASQIASSHQFLLMIVGWKVSPPPPLPSLSRPRLGQAHGPAHCLQAGVGQHG